MIELLDLLAEVGGDSLRASALAVEGVVAGAEGDLDAARLSMEDAIDLFQRIGAPFETARSRLDLARVLAALGRNGRSGPAGAPRSGGSTRNAGGARGATRR